MQVCWETSKSPAYGATVPPTRRGENQCCLPPTLKASKPQGNVADREKDRQQKDFPPAEHHRRVPWVEVSKSIRRGSNLGVK